tara:strand:+ start:12118 stop:12786 length:669 start_codon:yes stop_codon:yes gene_type:complete
MKNIIVFAAHADDEVLGCGATLSKYIDLGYKIKIIFFTDGVGSRKNNTKRKILKRKSHTKEALTELGISNFKYYDLSDNELDKYPILKIIKIIEKEILLFKPSIVFTHFDGDLNIDHQIISKATITACRLDSNIVKLYQYEVLSSTELNNLTNYKPFKPNIFVNVNSSLPKKISAMNKYKDELREWPNPRSLEGIKTLAKFRGMQSGQGYSEAFILIKELIS